MLSMKMGKLVHMVREEQRAQHAGLSYWRGITDIATAPASGSRLSIRGMNSVTVHFPKRRWPHWLRVSSPNSLKPIQHRSKRNVVGHSDVAPTRKEDPGELFDWARLAKLGLAVPRPSEKLVDPGWTDAAFLLALERYGYSVADGRAAVVAFQRRFRQENIDGVIDGESRAILWSLLLAYEGGGAT
jgi:N-acetylmuramoyl-L-alanine amidase